MYKNIAASLIAVGLLGAAVLAEDQDRAASSSSSSSSNQQDRSSPSSATGGQSDQSGAGAASGSSRDRSASGSSRTGAAGASSSYDQAQPAGARTEADRPETDPTKAFLKEASMSNLFEVQAGQIATQRVQDAQIKQFAQQMVQDHQQAQQQLKQVAQAAGMQLHDQLDTLHQAKLQKLQQCPTSEIGRKYINGQAAGHMMNVLEFRYQSQNAQNDQVKQLASQMLPKLEQHLKHATDLANQQAGGSGGDARTASERQRGDSATSGTRSGSDTGTGTGATSGTGSRSGRSGGSSSSSNDTTSGGGTSSSSSSSNDQNSSSSSQSNK